MGIAGKIKARGGGDAGTSLTTSNADLARNTYARGLLYFHHGLLGLPLPEPRELRFEPGVRRKARAGDYGIPGKVSSDQTSSGLPVPR